MNRIREAKRQELIDECGGRCELCGCQGSEMHEIVARHVAGRAHGKQEVLWLKANTVFVCRPCHDKVQGRPMDLLPWVVENRSADDRRELVESYLGTFKCQHEFITALAKSLE